MNPVISKVARRLLIAAEPPEDAAYDGRLLHDDVANGIPMAGSGIVPDLANMAVRLKSKPLVQSISPRSSRYACRFLT
jgi:hypothetical protein